MAQLIEYVHTLADEIGLRPATTDSEHRAADWLAQAFGAYGLETEVQEFDAPRTYSWAYALYHLFSIAAAFAVGFKPFLAWPAVLVGAATALVMWLDLDTRWGLTHLMPKGPSQNVIARHVPRARRGERLRKIVIVAHYDSARASLAFSPGMVGGFNTTFTLMKAITIAIPVLCLLIALPLPLPGASERWLWYATLAISAYLLVPLVINIHRELFMPFVPGANDNASGVAAMLGVMEQLVPAPDANSLATGSFPSLRRDARSAIEAGVVPEGAEISYGPAEDEPAEGELPADFAWAEEAPKRTQAVLEFDTIEFAAVDERPARSSEHRPVPRPEEGWTDSADEAQEAAPGTLPADIAGYDDAEESSAKRGDRGGGLLGRLGGGRRKGRRDESEAKDWLGLDDDFDARKAGSEIGSWDNFGGDDDDDGMGWKGGWAGDDPIEDPEFAANEAARIRRRVTESVDRELTEKEIWFVATGSEEVGTFGMQALLRDYGEELKDALIINIDNVGAGQLAWASAEGMARRYRAPQRLVGLARRVSRDTEIIIKPRVYKGLSTDATPALARGFKAISIMAFDAEGLPVNWHWKTDTSDNVDPELVQKAAEFVTAMVRDA